jgi:hypothetical protein
MAYWGSSTFGKVRDATGGIDRTSHLFARLRCLAVHMIFVLALVDPVLVVEIDDVDTEPSQAGIARTPHVLRGAVDAALAIAGGFSRLFLRRDTGRVASLDVRIWMMRRFVSWAGTERKGRAAQVVGVGLSKVYTIA